MNRIIILFLFSLYSLTGADGQTTCARETLFGDVEFCLPEIIGLHESYLEPSVKVHADQFEVPMNEVLGFYLNDTIYEKRADIGNLTFDDYAKVYGTKELRNVAVTPAMLPEIKEMIGSIFNGQQWDEVQGQVADLLEGIEIGAPYVVKEYFINDKSFSYIMLVKYELPEIEAFTMAMTVNGLIINDRLIWTAYYLKYHDESTISELEAKSNAFISAFFEAN